MSTQLIQSAAPSPAHEVPPLPRRAVAQPGFRIATKGDALNIARIFNDALPRPLRLASADAPAPAGFAHRSLPRSRLHAIGETQVRPWLALHETSGRPLWLAEVGGQTVGWLSLLGFFDRPGCACAAEIAIYVAKDWQRQGIGSSLLHKAESEAGALGFDRLMAFIWRDNVASLRLFDARGYVVWGLLPEVLWVEGCGIDMVVLGRKLGPAHDATPDAEAASG